jgi:hypothetical protein
MTDEKQDPTIFYRTQVLHNFFCIYIYMCLLYTHNIHLLFGFTTQLKSMGLFGWPFCIALGLWRVSQTDISVRWVVVRHQIPSNETIYSSNP